MAKHKKPWLEPVFSKELDYGWYRLRNGNSSISLTSETYSRARDARRAANRCAAVLRSMGCDIEVREPFEIPKPRRRRASR